MIGRRWIKLGPFFCTDDIEAVKLGSCNISGVLDINIRNYSSNLHLVVPPALTLSRNSEIRLAINSDIAILPNR